MCWVLLEFFTASVVASIPCTGHPLSIDPTMAKQHGQAPAAHHEEQVKGEAALCVRSQSGGSDPCGASPDRESDAVVYANDNPDEDIDDGCKQLDAPLDQLDLLSSLVIEQAWQISSEAAHAASSPAVVQRGAETPMRKSARLRL